MSQPIVSGLKYGGASGSHWEGCEAQHWDCRIVKLQADLARLQARVASLEEVARIAESLIPTMDYRLVDTTDLVSALARAALPDAGGARG